MSVVIRSIAASQSPQVSLRLTWAVHCSSAREAVLLAEELRVVSATRVTLKPSPLRRSSGQEWVVEMPEALPGLPAADDMRRRQSQIESCVSRWAGAWFLGWKIAEGAREQSSTSHHRRGCEASPGGSEHSGVLRLLTYNYGDDAA